MTRVETNAILRAAWATALGLALTGDAAAEPAGGAITGTVIDQAGLPLKGVKITAASATQGGAAHVAYSNDEGLFRVAGLSPGVFKVTASAPKLKTQRLEGVRVAANAETDVTFVMELESEVEELRIVNKAPTIDTKNASKYFEQAAAKK